MNNTLHWMGQIDIQGIDDFHCFPHQEGLQSFKRFNIAL